MIISWLLYIFIDDRPVHEGFVCKVCQKSSLSFFVSTSTHKRAPCQRISFFEVFFLFFEFFEKMVEMASMVIR